MIDEVINRLKELYPTHVIAFWVKDDRAKLFIDDHAIVKYLNVDLLEKQLKAGGEDAIREMVKYFAEYLEVRYLRRIGQFSKKKGFPAYNFTKAQIEYAIANTKSNLHAARFLNITLNTYKKYASQYNLYESHKNRFGFGITRSKIYPRTKMEDILANKHPQYPTHVFKERLIKDLVLPEECELCGYHDRREEDGKMAILLDFKDGSRKNMSRENIRFICYNCAFKIRGKVSIRHKKQLTRQLNKDESKKLPNLTDDKSGDIFEQLNKK